MGDVNIDFLKFCDNIQTEEYLDMIYLNNFLPLITKPTRITDHSKSLIHHMYTNCDSSKIRSTAYQRSGWTNSMLQQKPLTRLQQKLKK